MQNGHPPKWNQTARISLHHIVMSKSIRQHERLASLLGRVPHHLAGFSHGAASQPAPSTAVTGYLGGAARNRNPQNAGDDEFFGRLETGLQSGWNPACQLAADCSGIRPIPAGCVGSAVVSPRRLLFPQVPSPRQSVDFRPGAGLVVGRRFPRGTKRERGAARGLRDPGG